MPDLKTRYKVTKASQDGTATCALTRKFKMTPTSIYYCKSDRGLAVKPPRVSSYGKIDPWREIIDEWIKERLKKHKKKRFPAKELFDHMKANYPSFNASRSTVYYYARFKTQILGSNNRCILRLVHKPHECQADFATFFYNDTQSVMREGSCVTLSFPHSNTKYLQIFPGQSAESMLTAMQNIFWRIGGVPQKIWLDNDTCFVRCTVAKKKKVKIINALMQSFIDHYKFEPIFMNIGASHEKGSVEKAVGFCRRNLLVPLPTITDFAEYNRELLERSEKLCDEKHYSKGFNMLKQLRKDVASLNPLPSTKFACERVLICKCDKLGFVRVGGCRKYFIGIEYAKSKVEATLSYGSCIIRSLDGSIIYSGDRLYRRDLQKNIDWASIVTIIKKRPEQLPTVPIVYSLPRAVQVYVSAARPLEITNFARNLDFIIKSSDFETAVKVAEICILKRCLKREDFLSVFGEMQSP